MKSIFSAVFFPLLISTLFSLVKTSNIDENGPFRMRKVNLLWQKAKRMELSEETLNELYVELERQDRDERKWKHQRTEGKDKFGEMEAILRRNLLNIMDKYGLTGRKDSSDSPEETGDHIATNRVHRSSFVKDERLEKLWDHAVNEEKFSKEELEELRQELTHHHEKWRQYQDLVALISEHEDRKSNVVGNKIPHDEETISKLREEMNMKQQKVNNNYRRLKVKVLRGISDDDYKDLRVRELWKRAKAQGLSQEELELMKEELRHFDNRIAKHDDLEEQLDVAEDLLRQGHEHIKAKHEKLSAKVKEHKKYIKKLHATLDKKIGPHNEL